MSKTKVELNLAGLSEFMKSPEMQAHLASAGRAVANMAGKDYSSRVHVGDYTAIVNVYPDSKEAAKDNRKNHTVMKALGASGFSGQK